MTAVLHHTRYPALRILIPATGEIKQFQRVNAELGVLVINEDDPAFDVVMEIARKDPAIRITKTGILLCAGCDAPFTGKMAKALLAKHQKATGHTGEAAAPDVVAKADAKWSCPVDGEAFKTEAALISHTEAAHAPKPKDDVPPETKKGRNIVGPLTTGIPAAKPRG